MNSQKIKVLCLSFRTPPAVRPQAILIGKMLPEWIRQGLSPVVITYEGEGDWDINAPVYKIPKLSLNKYLNKFPPLRMIFRRRYYRKLGDECLKIIKEHGINIIFSFSNPQESNILGAIIKDKTGLPFISHFSDPWYNSPLDKVSVRSAKRILKQERRIIEKSDMIVFVNERLKGFVMEKYTKKFALKTTVIPHCYDLKDYPQAEKREEKKFVFSYIGVFYKMRNPEIFFMALSRLLSRQPGLGSRFIVRLIGAANNYTGFPAERIRKMVTDYDLTDQVEIISAVSYKKSLEFMKKSDCLLVIDADIANSPFLPSKVIDYAGSGTPILGITPVGSPTDDFLSRLGFKVFSYSQIDALADFLGKLISEGAKGEIDTNYLGQFNVVATTEKWIKIFKEAVSIVKK